MSEVLQAPGPGDCGCQGGGGGAPPAGGGARLTVSGVLPRPVLASGLGRVGH